MKKIYLLVMVSFISVIATAQFQKGNVLVGGTLNFSSSRTENDLTGNMTGHFISLQPSAGIFYRQNRMAGITLRFISGKNSSNGNNDGYGAGVFLRQYLSLSKVLYFFSEEALSYSYSKNKYQAYNYTQNFASLNFSPGIALSVTPRFQIELSITPALSLYYSTQKSPDPSNVSGNYSVLKEYGMQVGPVNNTIGSLGFGFKYLFR